jgi:signal transduction histidine kinase
VRVVVAHENVTKRRAAEEALKDADRRKNEFLAMLAHELRNPLAPIRNSLHILKLVGGAGAEAAGVHAMMERQVNHMVRLVDDLLEVSRITRGKIDLRRARVDLAAVLRTAVETSRPLIDAAAHTLTVDVPDGLVVDGDAVRLAQVFANLLNNAAKYTDPGGAVVLRARPAGADAVVTVRDTGAGIPAEMLSRVFELFTQIDRSDERAQGGLGIGLTLVKSLVELHGGRVAVRSDGPGTGSEFEVRLPLAAPS